MIIKYIVDNETKISSSPNDDYELIVENKDNYRKIILNAKNDIYLVDAIEENVARIFKNSQLFLNGYQSWTDTNEYEMSFKEKDIHKVPKFLNNIYAFTEYGDSHFLKFDKNHIHGLDIFYSVGKNQLFYYSLNYKNAFLVFDINKKAQLLSLKSVFDNALVKKGNSIVIFEYKYFNCINCGKNSFQQDFPALNKEKMLGYTSWYNYYQNINEKILLRDLDALDARFNLFQIDDGFEKYVGDWLDIDENKFPNGLKPIVDQIHAKGLKSGIWLAPFVAETKSNLFKEHPDYFAKDENGNFYKCGGSWSGFYALDLTKEEVWEYIEKSLKYYIDLGIDFFKLDFLYAASRPLYKNVSRANVSYESYARLRKILKDKTILGCGAVLSSSYQNVDYMRVGPDVSLKFDDVFYMKFFHRERISTKITVQNTITRFFMNNHLFGNDPDVFLLRDDNIKLSNKQKESLLMINSLFSNILLTSDNIATYNDKQKAMLNKALDIYYHAGNKRFRKSGNIFVISYTLNKKEYSFKYNSKTGVIIYG